MAVNRALKYLHIPGTTYYIHFKNRVPLGPNASFMLRFEGWLPQNPVFSGPCCRLGELYNREKLMRYHCPYTDGLLCTEVGD